MSKKSKLPEKSSRIAEIRETKWDQLIPDYLQSVTSQVSESARSQRFLLLLDDLFGIQPGLIEDYVAGIEKFIKVEQKDRILKGEVDNLFGNLVIEFERDLRKKQDEAEDQLKKYIACLWSQESSSQQRPYLCLATDGVSFAVYSPITDLAQQDIQPESVNLKLIEQADWSQLQPKEIYFWLDRYFLRQEILIPKSEDITKDFGAKSHAFQTIFQALFSRWDSLKEKPEYKILYESWEKYLRIVYGTLVAEAELFCRHTYLATLAKLMAWSRLSEVEFNNKLILSVLDGTYFKGLGFENFVEEDFFSWIVREDAKKIGLEAARLLSSLLANYNLRALSEDVLKSLYQELVDPRTRHDLGEFYTPDWLAHRIIRKLMQEKADGSFLDPSCGSGTFLYLAIREKKNQMPAKKGTLDHILNSVYGIDIHPLAVIVAKTNYILALGDLLKKHDKITIPIYLSNTIRPPEKKRAKDIKIPIWFNGNVYGVGIEDKEIYFSEAIIKNPNVYDAAIECAKAYAVQHAGKKANQSDFDEFIQVQYPDLPADPDSIQALFHAAKVLKDFIEQSRDTIWAFIFKNIYKPIFLKGKFDFVVGNPPWLSFRYAEPGYQSFLREQITKNYHLLSGRGELITHLELGTLFFFRAADLYLKDGGSIAFVLPRSIFAADQHDGLRRGTFKGTNLLFKEVWDLEKTAPLFNVPACVLIAQKTYESKISYPILGWKIEGKLYHKNASLDEAEKNLSVHDVEFYLHKRGKRSFWDTTESKLEGKESYYKKHFYQGATIVPRSFWFVEVKAQTFLSFDPTFPPLESSERAKKEAKNNYRDLILSGNVENQYLYVTLLSTDLLPFGHLDYRLLVLPIEPIENHYRLITAQEARKRHYIHLAQWLENVEEEWQRRRGSKAEGMSSVEWLDYRHKLSSQNHQIKYRVLYNTSGSFLCACVVENKPIELKILERIVPTKGIVADSKTYFFETNNQKEGEYLSTVLNASIIDKLIKPMQSRGLWGPRDICKKVFEIAIPQFDQSNPDHLRLSELSKGCSEKVANWIKAGGTGKITSIGFLRRKVRELLNNELREIDMLVKNMLS